MVDLIGAPRSRRRDVQHLGTGPIDAECARLTRESLGKQTAASSRSFMTAASPGIVTAVHAERATTTATKRT